MNPGKITVCRESRPVGDLDQQMADPKRKVPAPERETAPHRLNGRGHGKGA